MDEETRRTLTRAIDSAAKGGFRDALATVESLENRFPENEEIAFEKVSMISRHAAPGFALKAARDFTARFPTCSIGPLQVAHVLVGLKKGREALAEIAKAESLGAPENELHGVRIRALAAAGKKADALALAQSGSGSASLMLKLKLQSPKTEAELDKALDAMEAAGRTSEILLKLRASWYLDHGMAAKASDCLREGLEANESSLLLNDQMAYVELKMGMRAAALRRYEKILERDPDNSRARMNAAWTALKAGRVLTAVKHFRLDFNSVKSLYGRRAKKEP